MGDAAIGGVPGPGWVRVEQAGDRWVAHLTATGRARLRPQAGARAAEVLALREDGATVVNDWLAEEVPVALVFNGISHAVMMATPADLEDFALGFSLTEGLLADPGELRGVDIVEASGGIEVRLEVSSACEWRLKERRRNLAGRTGCGLCGTDSLAMVRQTLPLLPEVPVAAASIAAAVAALRTHQALQQLTGATHAAALCRLDDGAIESLREDVGRHNALDKLIGAAVREGRDRPRHFIAITSRASFEMVQKAALAGVPALAAISAPTAMAVALAQQCGLLLVGLVRPDGMSAYTFAQRLLRA
ncbi:MAG: formate dehydrogenase accessory sulfurtransferase FdhD [Hydrogenophaga sp.]|nr:formate dehydrogenase accessory sulfurtransferase FdhD [Hydrogenophaga sp.]